MKKTKVVISGKEFTPAMKHGQSRTPYPLQIPPGGSDPAAGTPPTRVCSNAVPRPAAGIAQPQAFGAQSSGVIAGTQSSVVAARPQWLRPFASSVWCARLNLN